MRPISCRWVVVLALMAGLNPANAGATDAQTRWFRGNTHTHTNKAAPDVVARWYREHHYHFVVLTDVNRQTAVEGLNSIFAAPGRFLVLDGIEISQPQGKRLIDVNGIGLTGEIDRPAGGSIAEMLNSSARVIRRAGGIPIIDHPNLTWALTDADIAAASEFRHFEVWNAEPGMHNRGGGGSPSTEEIWDAVLSRGQLLYGLAVDDSHDFHGEFGQWRANPGRAWIMVRASELSRQALLDAIDKGDFYASTGVELLDYEVSGEAIHIELPEEVYVFDWLESGRNPTRYRTYFIGRSGEVLAIDESLKPRYEFRGDELYVRARIEDSSGAVAWTQPVFPPHQSD